MLFATAVLFVSQSFYGPLTLPVFLALVVGYMFKDRIKEILRVYFSQMVSSVLFDHKTRIYSNPNRPIGICRESFDFVDEAREHGVRSVIEKRHGPFGDYSQGAPEDQPRRRSELNLS